MVVQRKVINAHSRPQSSDPLGQRHGLRALAGSEAGGPRITDFRLSEQPQKFETITVTIGYKNGQLLRLRIILAPARALDPWHWPKESPARMINVFRTR